MIKIKHFLDPIEDDDGARIWVEPIGLTSDLRQWCKVNHMLCHLAPPPEQCEWFEKHPDGYDYFRARYHEWLARSSFKPALQQLAWAATRETLTLLHQGDDVQLNSAMALYEFLAELEAYCPPDSPDR